MGGTALRMGLRARALPPRARAVLRARVILPLHHRAHTGKAALADAFYVAAVDGEGPPAHVDLPCAVRAVHVHHHVSLPRLSRRPCPKIMCVHVCSSMCACVLEHVCMCARACVHVCPFMCVCARVRAGEGGRKTWV